MADVTRKYAAAGLEDGWIHEDGTPCPEYLARDDGTRWWCPTHEQYLKRPAKMEPPGQAVPVTTLTREEALAELAALPGYDELIAGNVLFEAFKQQCVTVHNGTVFVGATNAGRFVIARVQPSSGLPDGAADAALQRAAVQAGVRVPGSAAGPRWCYYIPEGQRDEHGYIPSIVTEGEPGHTPLTGNGPCAQPWHWGHTLAEAQATAEAENAKRGLSQLAVLGIVLSSMGR